jgi:hypothetical protein
MLNVELEVLAIISSMAESEAVGEHQSKYPNIFAFNIWQ